MTSKIDPKYNVPGLDRALSIIELLNGNPAGLSVNEISHSLKYPLNSVYRIMMTLERRHYVRKKSGGSVFVLSDKFLTLATPVAGEPAFVETAMPYMRDLRDITQETVLAGVLVGNEGVVLEQCEGLHPFQLQNIHRVTFLPAHGGTWETFSSTSGTEEKDQDNQFPEIEKTNPQYDHHQRRFRKRSIACCPKWLCR